ncbi:MAG: hypothetical protein IJI45_07630 [Anaerolineaceae bacterium]|nr:hypothetical protein [Anaerolineaceae bacterium]
MNSKAIKHAMEGTNMSDLGTNVDSPELQQMLNCKNGKHVITRGTIWESFTYNDRLYKHGQCAYCLGIFWLKDGKVISADEYDQAYKDFRGK